MTTSEVELARPSPQLPTGVETGSRRATWGAPVSAYTRRLFEGLRTVYPGGRLTSRTIEIMRRHYHVSACLLVQTLPLLRADTTVECDDEDVATFLTAAWDRVRFDVMRSSTRALWAGYSPNELVADVDPDLGGIVWTQIRDLPPETCHPAVDDVGDYGGLVQNEGQASEVFLDAAVTLWLVEGMESGNLYGRSLLDAALDPWSDYAAIRAFHARYLERFGEPVVKMRAPAGKTVANAAEIEAAVAAGDTPPDAVLIDNLDTAQQVGENLRHHSVATFPADPLVGPDGKALGFSWDAEYLEAARSGGSDFLSALDHKNRAIARAIFVPDLLFTNTETGAYATSKTHETVWNQSVEGRLDDYSRQITRQIVDPLRRWNFGDRSPQARLVFSPPSQDDREQLWNAALKLIDGKALPVEVRELGERLGIPLADDGVEVYPTPAPAPPPPGAGSGMERDRVVVTLAAATAADVTGLPEWKLPQSYDPPAAYARELNPRERRVGFRRIELGMNAAEDETIRQLVEILERERKRATDQVAGIIRKADPAEILTGLGTIELRGTAPAAAAWRDLMRATSSLALDALREELVAYADKIPATPGPAGEALIRSYATSSAERVFAAVTTELRLALLNAYTSGVAAAGLGAVVADTFAGYEAAEGRAVRLTTRSLSAKALNVARRSGVERAGIPLRGAQYSAILDRRTCDLCRRLDETVIPITHTDLARFTPPVHHNCRCVWVWITQAEADFTPTWETPPSSMVDRFGGLVF